MRNFAGFDYIVTPSGSCIHHVREHLTAIAQTAEVQQVRAQRLRAGRVPARRAEGRARFRGPSSRTRSGCTTAARTLRGAAHGARRRRSIEPAFSKPLDLLVEGQGHRVRHAGAAGRVLRLRRHLLGVRGAGVGEDGLRQGQRPQPRRRRVHRLGRHVVPDAPEGLRRAPGPAVQVHPHRADPERSARHEEAHRPRRGVVEVHRGDGPRRVPRPAPVGPAQEARPRERGDARVGGAARARLGDQGAHAHPSRRLPGGVRAQRHRQRRARALGARRRRAQPDRATTSCATRGAKTAGQDQVDAHRRVRDAPLPRAARHRGDRDRPRRAHPAARRRAAEPHRGAGGAQAAQRRGRGLRRAPSAPIPTNSDVALPGREPAPAHAAVLPRRRRRHDRRQLRRRRDRQLRRLHQRGQRRPERAPADAATSPRSASRS